MSATLPAAEELLACVLYRPEIFSKTSRIFSPRRNMYSLTDQQTNADKKRHPEKGQGGIRNSLTSFAHTVVVTTVACRLHYDYVFSDHV